MRYVPKYRPFGSGGLMRLISRTNSSPPDVRFWLHVSFDRMRNGTSTLDTHFSSPGPNARQFFAAVLAK